MRLIDADELKAYFGFGKTCEDCEYEKYNCTLKCEQEFKSFYNVCDAIDAQETLRCANCDYFRVFRAMIGKGHCRRFDDVRYMDDYCTFMRKRTKEKKIAVEGMFYEID